MATEVKLSPGWLARDLDRAARRHAQWKIRHIQAQLALLNVQHMKRTQPLLDELKELEAQVARTRDPGASGT